MNKLTIYLVFSFLISTTAAFANDFSWQPKNQIKIGGLWGPNRGVNDQNTSVEENRLFLDFTTPLYQGSHNQWQWNMQAERIAHDKNISLGNNSIAPRQLWKTAWGTSFSRKLENGSTFAFDSKIESNSNKPYKSVKEIDFVTNINLKVPTESFDYWSFYLNINTGRSFLPYLPLPGFSYFYNASEEWKWIFGLPFLGVIWRPGSKWLINATLLAPFSGQAKLSYYLFGPAHLFTQIKYGNDSWRLADRDASKEFLYFRELTTSLGAVWPIASGLLAEISGEYHSLRKFSIAEKTTDDTTKKAYLEATPAVQLKMSYRF